MCAQKPPCMGNILSVAEKDYWANNRAMKILAAAESLSQMRGIELQLQTSSSFLEWPK